MKADHFRQIASNPAFVSIIRMLFPCRHKFLQTLLQYQFHFEIVILQGKQKIEVVFDRTTEAIGIRKFSHYFQQSPTPQFIRSKSLWHSSW